MLANWFIGIVVPPGEWVARLPSPPPGVRAFAPGDMHLTVAFLGPVTETVARSAWAAFAWPLGPTDVTLGAVVPMGPPARYSALSALLQVGRESVEAAIGAARGPCWRAAGTPPDTRPAKAHLTLARPARRATVAERRDALDWAATLDLSDVTMRLDTAALYTWSPERSVRLFEAVEKAALPRV